MAARYAKAPSYSEMLASEARAAVRAAEAVSKAALEAQTAAESLLAGLEAAAVEERSWQPALVQDGAPERVLEPARKDAAEPAQPEAAFSSHTTEKRSFGILWEADMPVREATPSAVRATHGSHVFGKPAGNWWEQELAARDAQETDGIEVVEPAQPIHANLIEFPRELVATRKLRPRLAEGTHGEVGNAVGQLSIFEVDPGSISFEPAVGAAPEAAMPAWQCPDWSSIQLDADAQSVDGTAFEDAKAGAVPAHAVLELAPVSERLLATVVDGALIAGVLLAAAGTVVHTTKVLPPVKEIELASVIGLAVMTALYQVFFFTMGSATPGMCWARLSLCTFGGERPARGQRFDRLWALALSLIPVGLGVLWAIFDEQHLSWHDRLSETYVRKR